MPHYCVRQFRMYKDSFTNTTSFSFCACTSKGTLIGRGGGGELFRLRFVKSSKLLIYVTPRQKVSPESGVRLDKHGSPIFIEGPLTDTIPNTIHQRRNRFELLAPDVDYFPIKIEQVGDQIFFGFCMKTRSTPELLGMEAGPFSSVFTKFAGDNKMAPDSVFLIFDRATGLFQIQKPKGLFSEVQVIAEPSEEIF